MYSIYIETFPSRVLLTRSLPEPQFYPENFRVGLRTVREPRPATPWNHHTAAASAIARAGKNR